MWCFCTLSNHHICNVTSGMTQCQAGIRHCLIGRAGSKIIQSCWILETITECPDKVGQCYLFDKSERNPACCCKGHLCNGKMITMISKPNLVKPSTISYNSRFSFPDALNQTTQFSNSSNSPYKNSVFIFPVIFLILIFFILIVTLTFIIKRINSHKNTRSLKKSLIKLSKNNQYLLENNFEQNLICKCTKTKLIAHGRFGQVWLGKIHLEQSEKEHGDVAIKIFSNNSINKRSWENESLIYSILRSQSHPNILYCFGTEKVQQVNNIEMWLVVQYHALGSLWEYLTHNRINWEKLLSISQNIASGLTHLHSFSQSGMKSIAHRDIKSKNILLKDDLTACIADFGLAICQKNYDMGINNIVGTNNYMAPEILEGSINLTIMSFLPVDIFSMSLVFWELLNRCIFPGIEITKFTYAFENIVGEKPTLNEMHDCVVAKKLRPKFNENWSQFPNVRSYWETICECWDEDPDARLSSECVKIRIEDLQILDNFGNVQNKNFAV